MNRVATKPFFGVPTRSDAKRAVQPQFEISDLGGRGIALSFRCLKFQI